MRLEDFLNKSTIQKVCNDVGHITASLRDAYLGVQGDVDESWSITNALSYIGLNGLTSPGKATRSTSEHELKAAYSTL